MFLQPQYVQTMASVLTPVFAILTVIYLISGVDDALVDVVALIRGLRLQRLSDVELRELSEHREKAIAIVVPAWDEGDIIGRMLSGNLPRLEYENFHIFVGVYPNDPATLKVVSALSLHDPRVHAVVNQLPGPSSKGQILNHVFRTILASEADHGAFFEGFLMQDAEDLIHSQMLRLINARLETYDFIQTPVFSLAVGWRSLVAGIYIDEFAELHSKDLLVREAMGGGVPSAGVGTALSRHLVTRLLAASGHVLNEGTLTEDYELGLRVKLLGFPQNFAGCYYDHPFSGEREYIATREFFPKSFRRSIRQKTRWTIGIALQGWRNLGWPGGWGMQYFLWRDRKGLLTNIAGAMGYLWLFGLVLYTWAAKSNIIRPGTAGMQTLYVLAMINLGLSCNRLGQRLLAVARVYGPSYCLPIIVRWPVGNLINAAASLIALRNDWRARIFKRTLTWVKTEHELPQNFGNHAPEIGV